MANEQSGHWYYPTGESCHTVTGKNGKARATTIRDARALGLLPSVTTILKMMAPSHFLVQWQQRQVAMAALTYPKQDTDILDEAYLDRVIEDAFKQVDDAADLGGEIHAALEAYFSEQPYDEQYKVYVESAADWMHKENIHVMQRELTLVNTKTGYAGRTDLLVDSPRGLAVGDYKTRKSKPQYGMDPYEEHPTQVAAYYAAHFGEDLTNAHGFDLYVSTTEPGRVEGHWYEPDQLQKEWELFQSLCNVWRIRKGYDPRTP